MTRFENISYEELGGGLPVILLHGGRLNRLHMIDAREPVFEKRPSYRRICPDMPGHGTVAVLDCAGHGLAWERPRLFEAHVHVWLDRVEHAP